MSTVREPFFLCLLVTSRLDKDGYAYHGKTRAHIVAWTDANPVLAATMGGSLNLYANGIEIDHACRRRNCVEPTHLEAVTRDENERRKSYAWRARRTQCPRGHSMIGAAITPERGRLCRTCQSELKASLQRQGAGHIDDRG